MPEWAELKFLPFGPWVAVAVGLVAIPGVRDKVVLPLLGAVLRTGVGLVEDVVLLVTEGGEETEDLVAADGRAPAATG